MHPTHLSGVDLNLLPALDALLRRRNVTRAAADVGLSQPAMSRALSRLRHLLDDPLLVRVGGEYALTPRASALRDQLSVALSDIRGMFDRASFDPAQVTRTVRIACSDSQGVLYAPGLLAMLAREAPGVDVQLEGYRPDMAERMLSGALDLAFATTTTALPPGSSSETIAHDELALVMRRGHPAARRKWTLADYGKVGHVGISILGDGASELDARLAAAGVRRRIALVTPQFYSALEAVAATDLVTTISRAFAQRFAERLDLVMREPPFGPAPFGLTLVSSHVRAADPFLVWFRGLVARAAQAAHAPARRPRKPTSPAAPAPGSPAGR